MTKKNKIYFGEFEEEQFLKFINEDNDFERNKIYSRYLHEPFKRMINLVLKSLVSINPSIETFDSLEEQMLGHLANAIPTYKPENGRAYTYFSYVLRNYGWELLRNGEKMQNSQTVFEYNVGEDEFEHSDFIYEMDEDIEKDDKLIKCVKDRIENTLNNRFVNIKDALVGKTLVELLNNSDTVIDSLCDKKKYDKRYVYSYIKERTGLKSNEIRTSLLKFKDVYMATKNDFIEQKFDI